MLVFDTPIDVCLLLQRAIVAQEKNRWKKFDPVSDFSKMNLHNRYASRFHRRSCILRTKSIGITLLCVVIVFIYSRVPEL